VLQVQLEIPELQALQVLQVLQEPQVPPAQQELQGSPRDILEQETADRFGRFLSHIGAQTEEMRDFVRPKSFDLVLSMFTSFGYFDDKQEDVKVLENIFASLREGGCCLIDLMGRETLARIFQPTHSHDLADGSILVARHETFDDWTRIRNEWILIKVDEATTHRFHHTVYSGQELRELLERVGFKDVRLYGNLDGDEYGFESDRLIVVGHKS